MESSKEVKKTKNAFEEGNIDKSARIVSKHLMEENEFVEDFKTLSTLIKEYTNFLKFIDHTKLRGARSNEALGTEVQQAFEKANQDIVEIKRLLKKLMREHIKIE